jgi:hypothetical protein
MNPFVAQLVIGTYLLALATMPCQCGANKAYMATIIDGSWFWKEAAFLLEKIFGGLYFINEARIRRGYCGLMPFVSTSVIILSEASKVQQMKRVYENAQSMHIWLGHEAENCEEAIDLLKIMAHVSYLLLNLPQIYITSTFRRQIQLESLKALQKIFDREYWHRV